MRMFFPPQPRMDDRAVHPRAPWWALVVAVITAAFASFTMGLITTGCGDESLVGTWTSAEQGETLEFRLDGTAILTMKSKVMATLTYEVKGTSLILASSAGVRRGTPTRTFHYSIKGEVLTLTFPDEDPARYVRVQAEGG